MTVKIFILNTGGTLGMVGKPLRPAMSAAELLEGIKVPEGVELTLKDFALRQDSTNISYADRALMIADLHEVYGTHDAFILLHGTDTLALTLAYLAATFAQTLQKPLFVIGSQMSRGEAGSDAEMQLTNTLRVAEAFASRRVVGAFTVSMNNVLAGARVRKCSDAGFGVFHTPGVLPVATVGAQVLIPWNYKGIGYNPVLAEDGLNPAPLMAENVMTMDASVDTSPGFLISLIEGKFVEGLILIAKGSGNIPDKPWRHATGGSCSWISVIRYATKQGVPVGILSPVEGGRVDLSRYELGQAARKAGAVSLGSLTPEMADVKLRIGIARKKPEQLQQYLLNDYTGELLPDMVER